MGAGIPRFFYDWVVLAYVSMVLLLTLSGSLGSSGSIVSVRAR